MISKFPDIYYVLKNNIVFSLQKVGYGKGFRVRGPIKLLIKEKAVLSIGNNFNLIIGLMLNPLGRNLNSFIRVDENSKIIISHNVGISCVTLWAKQEMSLKILIL